MSAPGIADVMCKSLDARAHDFTLCNFANADMVGHTGSMPATITAVETVDAVSHANHRKRDCGAARGCSSPPIMAMRR